MLLSELVTTTDQVAATSSRLAKIDAIARLLDGADEGDIAALSALQKRLLLKATHLLKPGGTLVYCTCSLEPEEGEHAIAALLASESGLRRAPVEKSEVAGLDDIITADGDLRTLPSHLPNADPRLSGLDGFYAARLVKS